MIKKVNLKKYLPSKQFQKIFGSVLLIIIIGFSVFFFFNRKENFDKKNQLALQGKSVLDITKTDTDGDGLYDWEESLWGTDKNNKFTYGEMSDSQYVENKRKDLNINKEINEKELTETDLFARQFFASYVALKATEGVNNEMINNFSKSLGNEIINQKIENLYEKKNVKINEKNDLTAKKEYYLKIKNLYEKYKESGIGDELNIVSNELISYSEKESAKYEELVLIGQSYQEFAKKIMEFYVPDDLIDYHIDIANNVHNTGIGVINMSKIISDPIIGMSGLSVYQEYSEKLIDSVDKLDKIIEEQL